MNRLPLLRSLLDATRIAAASHELALAGVRAFPAISTRLTDSVSTAWLQLAWRCLRASAHSRLVRLKDMKDWRKGGRKIACRCLKRKSNSCTFVVVAVSVSRRFAACSKYSSPNVSPLAKILDVRNELPEWCDTEHSPCFTSASIVSFSPALKISSM